MNAVHVIKRPIVTEKATFAMNEQGRYTFLVDRRATKDQIRRAIEQLYQVRVEHVTTQVRKGGRRRYRYGWVRLAPTKKAVVRLREGDRIDLF